MRLVSYVHGDDEGVGELEGGTVHRLAARDMRERLGGEGLERTGESHPLGEVELLAPLPEPPSIRDFLSYPDQLAAMARRRGVDPPETWRRSPAFHFANPASVHGPTEPVIALASTGALDFEVEVVAAIGAEEEIVGFSLLCDWTARDIEHRELAVGLGPHKSKDFATSIGPCLVDPDALPYENGELDLEIEVSVNGLALSRCPTSPAQFSWPQLVLAAAEGTRLACGDLLASGALPGGSLIELGREALDPAGKEPWLLPGDTVEISCEQLGTLTVPIA